MKNLTAYQAALSGAAYLLQSNAGFLRLSGADRVDFIQRQSTNDLTKLSSNQSVMTVLTSPTARILDVICVLDEGETLGIIPLSGRSEKTAQFMQSRIFFSDQVELRNVSSDFEQVFVFGPTAAKVLKKLGMQPPQLNQVKTLSVDNLPVIVIAQKILDDGNYLLLIPRPSVDRVLSILDQVGAEVMDSETFEILRIESGQPGPVGELTEAYTPLEIGFEDLISGSKGCYTGQEIIARQITYDKIAKKLVGIRLDQFVDVGCSLIVDEKSAGTLTSITQSPRFGVIGLGVVRRQFSKPGTKLVVSDAPDSSIIAEVSRLPFS